MNQIPSNYQGLTVDDVLGDTFETYLTLDDAKLLRDTFKGNKRLMRVLGKVFLPTIQDPEMTPESMAQDFWMDGKQWDALPQEEVKALVVARQDTIKAVSGGLIRLKAIANQTEESLQEVAKRRKKDSTK